MNTIYLKDFITTGRFGPVELGMTIDQVIDFLGELKIERGDETGHVIGRYDHYEFLFLLRSRIFYGIRNHNMANLATLNTGINNEPGICYTNNKFTVDTWFLEKNRHVTFIDVVNNLKKEDINFSIESGIDDDDKYIKCNSGVKIVFSDMSGFVWYNKDTDIWTYAKTIESQDEKKLIGIEHFDVSLAKEA
jgi:hypothetical protein